jgi:hypothetical protein
MAIALPPGVLAEVAATGLAQNVAKAGKQDHPVFDMYKEVHGVTTLNDEQKGRYQHIFELYEKSGEIGSSNYKTFVASLKELDKLDPDSKAKIAGRLIYHGAHYGASGAGLIADVVGYTDIGKNLKFHNSSKADAEPVSLDVMLAQGQINDQDPVKKGFPDWDKDSIITLHSKINRATQNNIASAKQQNQL